MSFDFAQPRSSVLAALPAAGSASIAGLSFSDGTLITPHPDYDSNVTVPVLWCTPSKARRLASDLPQLWRAFPTTGLWPVVLQGLDEGDPRRPWLDGELAPEADAIASASSYVVANALAGRWEGSFSDGDGPFPGLARATGSAADHLDGYAKAARGDLLGLVAVQRPADVLAKLGWMGAVNHDLEGDEFTAVLRSWEDRFGAVLVELGFDTMRLVVARPARDFTQAKAIAYELAALCPDNVHQGAGSLESYAEELVGATEWSFWWD
jgi:hypothetical protein